MTTIKDRLKMFETNGPPIKPKPKTSAIRKCSNTEPGIITATVNDESDKKSQNNLVNASEASSKIQNELNLITNEQFHEQVDDKLHQNQLDFNKTTNNIANNDLTEFPVKGCIDNELEKEINKESDRSNDIMSNTNNEIGIDSESDVTAQELPVDDSEDRDYNEEYAYEYHDAIYYLPGLENFITEGENQETTITVPLAHNESDARKFVNDLQANSTVEKLETRIETDPNIEEVASNLKRTASKRLIEEIFNTSVWRNSGNYTDNFIFTPRIPTDSINGTEFGSSEKISSNDISSTISSSPSNDEHRKSLQSLSSKPIKKNIFSSMFRSKRGPKKSHDKSSQLDQTNDIYDSDGQSESISKRKSTHSKTAEGDTDSAEQVTKKPLNSFFNRDWLNSLGEGIKKKANVMSELKKVFTHSKGKHLKGKPSKSTPGVSNEGKYDVLRRNGTVDDDIYDDGGEEMSTSEEEDSRNLTKPCKQVEKDKLNRDNPIISNDDDIYDDDDDDDNDDDDNDDNNDNVNSNKNNHHIIAKSPSKESIYDDGGEDEVSDHQNDSIHSSHDSIYDDGGEEETSENTKQEDYKAPVVEMRRSNVADLKNNLKINFNFPMKNPTTFPIQKPVAVNDSVYDDEDEESEEEKVVYSKDKVIEGLKFMHMKMKSTDIESKKLDLRPETIQEPMNTSSVKNDSVKNVYQKSDDINKKNEESKETINQSKSSDKKNKNVSDLKSFIQRIGKNKSKNEKSEKSKKVKSNVKKSKNNFMKSKNDNKFRLKQNEEYDMDDENVEEYESDVKNDDEVTTESVVQNLQKSKPRDVKLDEDTYDMDDNDVEEYVSDESDASLPESSFPKNITKLNIPYKNKNKLLKKEKINDDIYDDDEEAERINIKEKIKPQKLSGKTLEIIKNDTKVNNKTNKLFVEEYQDDENLTPTKDGIEKGSKKEKLKVKQNLVIKSNKKIDNNNSKKCNKVYDEEYDEEEFNEVYVSDTEIIEEKESNVTKKNSNSLNKISKKSADNLDKEKKKKLKNCNTNSKTKSFDSQNDSKKPNKKSKSAMETYIYDEDDPITNESPKNNCSTYEEFFVNDDPAVVKLIKKNLSSAKKTFKLKDDMTPESLAKVLKTIYPQHKNHLQLNIGELVQILLHKDNLVLVRNGLGKCGWTSSGNLQIVKLYESAE